MGMEGMSIKSYLEIALRRKWSFIISFLLITVMAVVLAYTLPDVYRSTTMIFVEPQKVPEDFVKPTITTKVEDRLKTITQQILSRTRLEKIIQEFGLYQGIHPRSDFERLLTKIPILNAHWNLIALHPDQAVERMRDDINVEVKGDKIFTISYQGANPEATMKVTNKIASLFIEENLKLREKQVEGTSDFLENELGNVRLLLEQQEQQIRDFKQKYMGELPEQLEANLRALDRFQFELKSTVERLKASEERKESIEGVLAGGQSEVSMGASTRLARLEQLKTHLANLQAEYKEDYPDIALTQKEIREIERALTEANSSPDDALGERSFSIPRDVSSQNLLDQLRELKVEISTLKAREANLAKQIRLYEKRVEDTPLREQQLMTILRDYENIQKNYQSLLNKRLEAKISENLEKRQQGEIFRILDPANYPASPYRPNRLLVLAMGLMIAVGGGVGLVFLREQLDPSFKTGDMLSSMINVPVLATIPNQPRLRKRSRSRNGKHSSKDHDTFMRSSMRSGNVGGKDSIPLFQDLVIPDEPFSYTAEQFRLLYTALERFRNLHGRKVFCVTSAAKGEGKTFTASNLAATIAKDFRKKTVLMDLDDKGAVAQNGGSQQKAKPPGWADVVLQKAGLSDALGCQDANMPHLLPAGNIIHPSSGLISAQAFHDMIEELRMNFDYVIIDTPPILPMANVLLLERMVDGIILTVRVEKTSRELVVKALSSLEQDKILGVVLNNVKRGSNQYYYYQGNVDSRKKDALGV